MDWSKDWDQLYNQNGRVFGEEPKPIVRESLKLWKPSSQRPSAFDIGSYSGRNTLFLAQRGFRVTALDPSKPALHDLKQQAEKETLACEIVEGFIEAYAWPESYDVIVFSGVSHSLATSDVEHVFERMRTHTKPGGINIVSAFAEHVRSHQKSFMPPERLREIYRDWKILAYEERVTSLKLPTPERDRVKVTELIAQRSG
jgi:tellurite methyltransferase